MCSSDAWVDDGLTSEQLNNQNQYGKTIADVKFPVYFPTFITTDQLNLRVDSPT